MLFDKKESVRPTGKKGRGSTDPITRSRPTEKEEGTDPITRSRSIDRNRSNHKESVYRERKGRVSPNQRETREKKRKNRSNYKESVYRKERVSPNQRETREKEEEPKDVSPNPRKIQEDVRKCDAHPQGD